MTPEQWKATEVFYVLNGPSDRYDYQQKALRNHNEHIDVIACSESGAPTVQFNEHFSYDLPGC